MALRLSGLLVTAILASRAAAGADLQVSATLDQQTLSPDDVATLTRAIDYLVERMAG